MLEEVPPELLEALAAEVAPEPSRGRTARFTGQATFDVEQWIVTHGITVERGPEPYQGGEKWVLKNCAFNPEHKAPDAAIFRSATGALGYKCLHNSCADKTWAEFRAFYEPTRAQRYQSVALDQPVAASDLSTLVAAAIAADSAEEAYNGVLVRAMALATFDGHKSEVLKVYERLQGKYKAAFKTTLLKELVKEELLRLRAADPPKAIEGWERDLIRKPGGFDGEPGKPVACEYNALLYTRNHPEFAGALAWDEFRSEFSVRRDISALELEAGEQVRDVHVDRLQIWLQNETGAKFTGGETLTGMRVCAADNAFHPVKQYLEALPAWDGVQRLPHWLATYCGAGPAESDESDRAIALAAFISAIGERWMLSAVARIYQPGCEVHHVLVLEGAKGVGKSTLVRTLFGEWSGSIVGDVATKDAQAMLSAGIWCMELEELGILGKSEMKSVKAFVTRPFEQFRPAYGHIVEKHPRQIVFLATVDHEDWADEEDRRWWPVKCNRQFDLDGLKADRDLLWAEALHKYRDGQRWHFHTDEDAALIVTAKAEQADRVPENVLAQSFTEAAEKVAMAQVSALHGSASVAEIMHNMEVSYERRKGLAVECGKCLVKAGWTLWRAWERSDGKRVQTRRYRNLTLFPPVT